MISSNPFPSLQTAHQTPGYLFCRNLIGTFLYLLLQSRDPVGRRAFLHGFGERCRKCGRPAFLRPFAADTDRIPPAAGAGVEMFFSVCFALLTAFW